MQTSRLKISIALCTYNGERFLKEQLESYAAQTRLPDEVVVCDDASADQTISILEEWKKSAPFDMKIVRNETNIGFASNFSKALSLCSGDVIFLSDQDDVWLPEKLEKMTDALEKSPEASVVYCDGGCISETGKNLNVLRWKFGESWLMNCEPSFISPLVTKMKAVVGCCIAMRRNFLNIIIPVPNALNHDVWIYYLTATVPKYIYLNETLILCRLHGRNASVTLHATIDETLAYYDRSRFHTPEHQLAFYWGAQPVVDDLRKRIEKIPENPNKRALLRMLNRNDRHYRNRDRIQRCLFLFFPLFLIEICTFHYFQYSMPLRNIGYDLKIGFLNSLKPQRIRECFRKILSRMHCAKRMENTFEKEDKN